MPWLPPKRTLRALRHLNADDALVIALDRRERNDDGPRALPRNATQTLTRPHPPHRGGGRAVSGPRSPLGLCGAAMAHASSASTDVAARRIRPGRHIPAARNLAATTDDESYHGPASELPPATSHGYAERDFSGVPNPVMFQRFLDAADYWFGYSDNSSVGSYNSARECFVVIVNDQANAANAAEAVQARRVRRPAAMRAHPSGVRAPSRYSRGRVRPPRGATHPRGRRVPSGLLLTHCGR
jgi:hypothetical protein